MAKSQTSTFCKTVILYMPNSVVYIQFFPLLYFSEVFHLLDKDNRGVIQLSLAEVRLLRLKYHLVKLWEWNAIHLFKITIISGKLNSNSVSYVKRFFSSEALSELVERTFTLYEQKSRDVFKTPKVA